MLEKRKVILNCLAVLVVLLSFLLLINYLSDSSVFNFPTGFLSRNIDLVHGQQKQTVVQGDSLLFDVQGVKENINGDIGRRNIQAGQITGMQINIQVFPTPRQAEWIMRDRPAVFEKAFLDGKTGCLDEGEEALVGPGCYRCHGCAAGYSIRNGRIRKTVAVTGLEYEIELGDRGECVVGG